MQHVATSEHAFALGLRVTGRPRLVALVAEKGLAMQVLRPEPRPQNSNLHLSRGPIYTLQIDKVPEAWSRASVFQWRGQSPLLTPFSLGTTTKKSSFKI